MSSGQLLGCQITAWMTNWQGSVHGIFSSSSEETHPDTSLHLPLSRFLLSLHLEGNLREKSDNYSCAKSASNEVNDKCQLVRLTKPVT